MKLMRRIVLTSYLLALMLCVSVRSSAQYYFYNDSYYDTPLMFEVGVSGGAMNCLTDIGGAKGIGAKFTKDLNIGRTEFTGGAYLALMYKYTIGLRLEANYGKVSAFDSVLRDVPKTDIARARYNRNLSFRSTISEVALVAEFHPLFAFIDYNAREGDPPRLSPYVLAGISYFSFNPQAKLNGRWVDLQPLSTEGQGFAEYPDRKPYKLNALGIPLGGGVKYELSSMFNVRLEFMYRATNTDYLDDVSTTYIDKSVYSNYFSGNKLVNAVLLSDRQLGEYAPQTLPGKKRGNVKDKDNFFSANLKIGLAIGRERIR
jgi:opacity protein-like surface antigen